MSSSHSISPPDLRRISAGATGWRLLPFAVFALLTLMTWKRWILPFQDSGRELLTASRLASGELLYRDVGSPYGPLPAYLDALAFRIFGKDLDVLIGLRLAMSLLGVEAIRRLLVRLAADEACASAITAFIAATCFFGDGGNYPFPYSVAALEGTVGIWWGLELALSSEDRGRTFLASLVAGLAGGTKLEMLPAALLAVAPPLFLRRPRREALAGMAVATFVAGSSFLLPIALLGSDVIRRYGFLIAFPVPEPWREMYWRFVLFAHTTPRDFLLGGFLKVWLPSVTFLALAVSLCRASISATVRALGLAFLCLVPLRLLRGNAEIAALLPAAAVLFVLEAVAFWRRRRVPDPAVDARLFVALAALPALARQPFFLRNLIYGAFSAPLALAVSMGWLSRLVSARRAFAVFLVGLAGAHAFLKWDENRHQAVEWVDVPHARLYLPAGEARFVRLAVSAIQRQTPPGAYVAAFPDPGFLLYSADRRSPFVDDVFYPGCQDAIAEEKMIGRLSEAPVAMVLVTNRNFSEYGPATYGEGVLDRFFTELARRYRPAATLSALPRSVWPGRHATMATLWLPREAQPP